MTQERCRHCDAAIKPAPAYTLHGWVHVTTGTWWCPATTTAEPRLREEEVSKKG